MSVNTYLPPNEKKGSNFAIVTKNVHSYFQIWKAFDFAFFSVAIVREIAYIRVILK